MIKVKTQAEIEIMRESGQILARTLKLLESEIRPGISTKYLDKIANEYIISCGGKPAFLHLYGFPASICSSIDEVVVHGIPRESDILQEGQIIGIDCGVKYKGFCSDAARTFGVGHISDEKQKLIDVTRESFFEGIKGLKANDRVGDIGARVQSFVEKHGFSVVRDLVGHGVGREMHEDPNVPNFGRMGLGAKLPANCTIAVEPMVNVGVPDVVFNGMWDVKTADHKPSAHYENTILITEDGVEILTILKD